jgi:2-(1,2-epoxy-1,2-dihydrophenyl)acetyl-CoA isomerase
MIREELKDGVYTITLNRPESKNAISTEVMVALYNALQRSEATGSHIIVLRGSGGMFSSGGDLAEFREGVDKGTAMFEGVGLLNKIVVSMRKTKAIIIAVLEGAVAGAGLSLSLACDLSIASKNTIMNMAYSKIGLTPDGGGSLTLPRLVGARKSSEFYLLSDNISADEAMRLGIVNFVCDDGELDKRLEMVVKNLKSLPTRTIEYFKDLINSALFVGLEEHLDKERFYVSKLAQSSEFRDRLDQFFGKRINGGGFERK